jgi:hypothetical protein
MDSVGRIQRAGLQVQGGFIVGFDSDPVSIFQRQIDFIQKSGIVTAMVGLLQAPAGTRLFERLRRENRLTGPISGDNADGSTNIIPKMGLNALSGYRTILHQIYPSALLPASSQVPAGFRSPPDRDPHGLSAVSGLLPLLPAPGHHWP